MKYGKTLCVILCLLLLLTGCAGMGDWTYELPGNVQIMRIHAGNIVLDGEDGRLVESFVNKISCTESHIFVQQTDEPPKEENSGQEVRYYIVFTHDGTVEGPMTQVEFEESAAAILPDTQIQWYSTTDGSLKELKK